MNPFYNFSGSTTLTPFTRARVEEVRAQFVAIAAAFDLVPATGSPGGNIMSVGSFFQLPGMEILAGTDLIITSECRTGSRKGGAFYKAFPQGSYAADVAFATSHPGWAKMTLNNRLFVLSEEQEVHFSMLGAYGNADTVGDGTDDYPQWLNAKDFIHFNRSYPSGNSDYKHAPAIHFGRARYYFSDSIDLTDAAYRLYGSGNNFNAMGGTHFWFAAGKCGIIIQSWDTFGVSGVNSGVPGGGTPRGGSSSHLADLSLHSKGGTVGAEQHGVHQRGQAVLDRIHCYDFGGNGINIVADTAGHNGNANAFQVNDCGAQWCGLNGLYLQGGDVNAGRSISFQAFNNRQWGISDCSFLGNYHLYFQTDGNGVGYGPRWAAAGTVGSTFTNHAGNYWRVRPGKHVEASTTTPGTDSSVWILYGNGATSLGSAWVSGHAYASGGAFYAGGINHSINNNGRNVFGGYAEGNQAQAWCDSGTSCCLPGFARWNGATLFAANNTIFSGSIGSQSFHPDGSAVQFVLGGDSSNDGLFASLGRGNSMNWTFHIAADNSISMKWLNGTDTGPIILHPSTNPVGIEAPRGIKIMNAPVYSSDGVPTSGTVVRGTLLLNTTPSPSGPPGWSVTTGGTIGSTAVLKPLANLGA